MVAAKAGLKTREDVSKYVAKKIAEAIPEDFVVACVEEAIRTNIAQFKVDDWAFKETIKGIVNERAKELLKTKYATQVELHASALCEAALAKVR